MNFSKAVALIWIKIQSYFFKQTIYFDETFLIILPRKHPLRAIRHKHKNYDRFLPILASNLDANKTIVDIGANIGDTLIAMCSKNDLSKYICVEPVREYYEILQQNISLNPSIDNKRITTLNVAISDKREQVNILSKSGTGFQQNSCGKKVSAFPLDDIISSETVALIKIDTDGFDWKVLRSGQKIISRLTPVLYFEVQIDNIMSLNFYMEELSKLLKMEYHFFFFDNYGNFLYACNESHFLKENLYYVMGKQKDSKVFYFDVLAVHPNDELYKKMPLLISEYVQT